MKSLIKTLTYKDFKSNMMDEYWTWYSKKRSLELTIISYDKSESVVIFPNINNEECIIPTRWIKK